jgi:hypothetical protein
VQDGRERVEKLRCQDGPLFLRKVKRHLSTSAIVAICGR